MKKLFASVLLCFAVSTAALVVPTETPSKLLKLQNGMVPKNSRPTLNTYLTPAMKKGGVCSAVTLSALVVALNIILNA
jgi:hypothetical protein